MEGSVWSGRIYKMLFFLWRWILPNKTLFVKIALQSNVHHSQMVIGSRTLWSVSSASRAMINVRTKIVTHSRWILGVDLGLEPWNTLKKAFCSFVSEWLRVRIRLISSFVHCQFTVYICSNWLKGEVFNGNVSRRAWKKILKVVFF